MIDPAPQSRRRWAIFTIGSLNFLISMFYRGSIAVIAPSLSRELCLDASDLSNMSAVFFYSFAISQIPIGIALDRIGARAVTVILALPAIAGGLLFSVGQSANELVFARVLLGIGMSGNLMIILTLLAAWFPVNRFASLSGIIVAIGSAGTLLAGTPLAALNLWIGWRTGFVFFSALNAIIVAAFILVIRNRPQGSSHADSPKDSGLFAGLSRLIKMYSYWAISLSNFVRYGYFAALQSLWIGPFLVIGRGWDELSAGNAILAMGFGYMIALPISGILSDRVFHSRKKVVLGSFIFYLGLVFFLLFRAELAGMWVLILALFGLGFLSAPGNILYAHMKELIPRDMLSVAMTAVNLFTTLGAGVMTHIIGIAVGNNPNECGAGDFLGLWYAGIVALGLVSLLYYFVPDSRLLRKSGR